ncbi:RidA family protein [Empedobacter brevis]|uniref:RidA family protein n=1 Tax=Empedobacter brevis TaxID=247 RepID=UPI00123CE4E3|nr:RidA family protein [Empedobacter brevis]QES91765.1 RidA family protein [Empedobacter brevis]
MKDILKFNTTENYKGYSDSIEVNLGRCKMLIISGQVPFDEQGNLIYENDLTKQTEQVFKNILYLIKQSNGTIDSLVKLDFFVKDISRINEVRAVRDSFINHNSPPTSTIVEVSNLFKDNILIEISATAIIK